MHISRDILHYIDAEYIGLPEAIWENKNGLSRSRWPLGFNNEYVIEDVNRRIFFRSKIHKDINLPEISVHFILMFILGMLCRYESECWGEILLSSSTSDMFIINDYLNISMRRYPNLILNQLFDELFVFIK
ncbi:YaaC family protein [Desulfuribacillus stibiiarsenatis]|uniref:YaaC family protein n=1 Tax=Desulfuribacillus stibiiarsenatis TaxID=1390249 RepID=UPI0009F724D5